MELAQAEIGVKEVSGKKDNPVILQYYREAYPSGRIDHDETPWCAAFVGSMLHRAGYPTSGLLTARSYLNYGTSCPPQPGCIVVLTRGNPNSWEGHVGFLVQDKGSTVSILGGNQGNRVSVASFPKSKVLAYRMPVAATMVAIKDAGSDEMKVIQTGSIVTGLFASIATGLNQFTTIIQQNAIVCILVMCALIGGVFWWWKKNRVKRHLQGQPISKEVNSV